jgi:hypothetical protein
MNPMPVDLRPAMPVVPPRAGAVWAQRDQVMRRLATLITVLAAATAVLVVAAAAVAFAVARPLV